jgi:hypothetical protein
MSLDRLFAVVVLILVSGCVSAELAEWRYTNPASHGSLGTLRVSSENHEVSFSEHISYEWVDCDKDKIEYSICFESPRLVMKLPHEGLQKKQWVVDGTKYLARIHEDVMLFGQSIGDIYVISVDGKGAQGYVYSINRGILAIFNTQAGHYEIVFVDGRCGYGAPATCYEKGR